MVEIEGERVLAASCVRKPAPGMKVHTNSERAEASQKLVFELLVADQPDRSDAHDPDSRFWNWADHIDVTESRFPRSRGRTRPRISAIPPWRCSSTPASSATCASAPAARSRSTT
jgi:predicted molibdopterin-dependent oxidoreductase YjgC